MRLSRYSVDKVALPYKKPKSEKGNNSTKYLQNFSKSLSGHLHLGHNVHATFYDPISSGSPDILMTRSFMG